MRPVQVSLMNSDGDITMNIQKTHGNTIQSAFNLTNEFTNVIVATIVFFPSSIFEIERIDITFAYIQVV